MRYSFYTWQDFFLGGRGGGDVDACKGCMCVLVHTLDFNEIVDIFKDI